MDGHLSGVMDSVDRGDTGCGHPTPVGIGAHHPDSQMDRVSGVFQCFDVSRGDTLVPKVQMCITVFSLAGT